MSDDNRGTQEEELSALKSIFDEEFQLSEVVPPDRDDNPRGKFIACVDLPGSFKVKWHESKDPDTEAKEMRLQHLPPLVLSFSLPLDYPTDAAPDFAVSCDWLSREDVLKLCTKLYELWQEDKDVILFKWASFLKEESLQFLNIVDELDVTELQKLSLKSNEGQACKWVRMTSGKLEVEENQGNDDNQEGEEKQVVPEEATVENSKVDVVSRKRPANVKMSLLKNLQEYNKQKLQDVFDKDTFCCDVCFITAAGSKCIQFQPCGHIFCKRCVREYVEVAIKEGRVQNLSCLETDCKSPVLQSHVKELVSKELFASYDQLLLTVSLTSMSDVTLCPFQSCETPVLFDPEENLASCPSCQYVFCIHCRMGYHGVEPCRIRTGDKVKLVREYLAATGKQKVEIEKRYGKRPLQILVNNVMSQQWIDANSKPCPKCNANIEKLDGCNKMTCWRCTSNFCWLCTKLITDPDPYVHYSTVNSKCNGMLFHGLPPVYDFDFRHVIEDDEEDLSDDEYFDYLVD